MSFTLTFGADDWGPLGVTVASGPLTFALHAPDLTGARVLTGETWGVALDGTGSASVDCPTVAAGNALRIYSYVSGFQREMFFTDPGTGTVTFTQLLTFLVDPDTLQPPAAGSTALQLFQTLQAEVGSLTPVSYDTDPDGTPVLVIGA